MNSSILVAMATKVKNLRLLLNHLLDSINILQECSLDRGLQNSLKVALQTLGGKFYKNKKKKSSVYSQSLLNLTHEKKPKKRKTSNNKRN